MPAPWKWTLSKIKIPKLERRVGPHSYYIDVSRCILESLIDKRSGAKAGFAEAAVSFIFGSLCGSLYVLSLCGFFVGRLFGEP